MVKLRWALECQLQRDAGLSFVEYHALARLSEQPGNTMRMSELAEVTNASLSRLSHLIKRLELRELVRREPDPRDGRFTNAILTRAGLRLLTAGRRSPVRVADPRPGSVTDGDIAGSAGRSLRPQPQRQPGWLHGLLDHAEQLGG